MTLSQTIPRPSNLLPLGPTHQLQFLPANNVFSSSNSSARSASSRSQFFWLASIAFPDRQTRHRSLTSPGSGSAARLWRPCRVEEAACRGTRDIEGTGGCPSATAGGGGPRVCEILRRRCGGGAAGGAPFPSSTSVSIRAPPRRAGHLGYLYIQKCFDSRRSSKSLLSVARELATSGLTLRLSTTGSSGGEVCVCVATVGLCRTLGRRIIDDYRRRQYRFVH